MRRRPRKAWDKLGLFGQIGVVVLGVALAALTYLFVLKWLPEWLTNDDLTGKDRAEDEGRNRTAVLATIAGMIAVAGAFFTGLSYRLNRAGQITERFTRAIDQLGATDESGKPKIDVVLGGIYALERIAKDSRDDHPQVVEVLTAYVREHARYNSAEDDPTAPLALSQTPLLATDVQAAMDVLARRDVTQDRPNHRLNLAGTDLRKLSRDRAEGGHLDGANFFRAQLDGADLTGAHLAGAILSMARLRGAGLEGAHLEGADLSGGFLDGVMLLGAHLEGANLASARLGEAHLERASLVGARLVGAKLVGARLVGANLVGANLERANLDGANLDGADLNDAGYDDETTWPTPEFEAEARERGARHVDDDDRPGPPPG